MRVSDILWIGVGGGVGSMLRWQVGQIVDRHIVSTFKFGTFFINISGVFLIAYISASLAIGWEHRYGDIVSSFVLTGILGGYTTFSTMQLDAVQMTETGNGVLAAFYLLASIVVGLTAAAAGVALARF